jgi:hypothetical protein
MTCSPARLRPPICSPGLEPLPSVTRSIENYGGHLLSTEHREKPTPRALSAKERGLQVKVEEKIAA